VNTERKKMRAKVVGLFVMAAILAFAGEIKSLHAQTEGIEELKVAIQKLEAIDSNPATPPDIKEINREFLIEKRAKLLPLLLEKRQSRREYLSKAISSLSADQIVMVEGEISDLGKQIKRLQSGVGDNKVAASEATDKTSFSSSNAEGTSVGPPAAAPRKASSSIVTDTSTSMSAAGVTRDEPAASAPERASNTSVPIIAPSLSAAALSETAVLSTTSVQTPTTTVTQATPGTTNDQFRLRLGGTAETIRNAKAVDPRATLNLQRDFYLLALALIAPKVEVTEPAVVAELTSAAEIVKTDKQTSSSQGTGGITSLVTKAGIPAVFGFAVENGALTRTDNRTIVSFSGTPVGIIETLARKGFISSYQKDDHFDRFLRNFSFKLNFDTDRGNTPGVFTGNRQQLAGYSLRYQLVDQRDPRDERYTKQWASLVENEGVAVTKLLAQIFTKWYTQIIREEALSRTTSGAATAPNRTAIPSGFRQWFDAAKEAVANAPSSEVEKVLTEQLDELRNANLGVEVNNLLSSFGDKFDNFLKRRDDILNQVNAGWSSTVEYNNERRLGLPSLSNIRFVAEKGAYNGSIDLTANGSITFLNSIPAGSTTQRLRDFSFSGQLDVPLGNVARTGKFMLSFAGLFERLATDEMVDGLVVASKGNIGVGQVKLTIPIRGTAFKIPLSFSFANRTELIMEKHVRGSFGLTFDLDSLLARYNPFSLIR